MIRGKSIDLWIAEITAWVIRISILALGLGIVGVIIYGYATKAGWVGVADKNFWDYLNLLIVPVILAFGAFRLNVAFQARLQAIQHARSEIAEAHEDQRTQDVTLEAYLEYMSKLVIDYKLTEAHTLANAAPLRAVARAHTFTVLSRLDGSRKGHVVRFWYESGVIAHRDVGHFNNIEDLVKVIEADPPPLNLGGADLSEANLREAQLHGAPLFFVNLLDADLRDANLEDVNLQGADLSNASLRGANLSEAWLPDTNLSNANFSGTNLRGAHLTSWGVYPPMPYEELEQQAKSLEGATMPNGQKYEDWLKSREGDGG